MKRLLLALLLSAAAINAQTTVTVTGDGAATVVSVGTAGPQGVAAASVYIANAKDYGAIGNGVADDTVAIQAALNSGRGEVYLPYGTYKTTTTLTVPTGVWFHGAGRASVLAGSAVSGAILKLYDNYGVGGASVEHIAISGTATTALEVNKMTGVSVRDVQLLSGTLTDGFVFSQTYGSTFEQLRSNGPTISGKCFSFGQAFNSNMVITLYTSNSGAAYNFYLGSATESPAGNTFSGLAAQGGSIGLYVGNSSSNTFNGFYTESVLHPIILGTYSTELAKGLVFNAAILSGPYTADAAREVLIDIVYADAVEFIACQFSGSTSFVSAAPIDFTGGGGSGAQAIGFVKPDGTLGAIRVLNGGSGYTSNPGVTIGGAGANAVATAVRTGNVVTSVNITNPGTGYGVVGVPPIRFNWSVAGTVRFSGCTIAGYPVGGGLYSQALWPWIVAKSTSPGLHGVIIDNDVAIPDGVSLSSCPARMEKLRTAGYSYDHWVSWRDSAGALTGRIYVPPVYP